jgi:hypothetical protein
MGSPSSWLGRWRRLGRRRGGGWPLLSRHGPLIEMVFWRRGVRSRQVKWRVESRDWRTGKGSEGIRCHIVEPGIFHLLPSSSLSQTCHMYQYGNVITYGDTSSRANTAWVVLRSVPTQLHLRHIPAPTSRSRRFYGWRSHTGTCSWDC